jgi:energy-coupling factor transporter ATP-binding protein EcfA2
LYVEKLTIKNFRCFAETEIELNYPGRRGTKSHPLPKRNRNVNLFLGGNGSGKSSVFKALALGVLAPVIQSSGFKAEYLVRRGPDEAPSANGGANGAQKSPPRPKAEIEAALILDATDTTGEKRAVGRATIQRLGDVETIGSDVPDNDLWEGLFLNDSPAFFLVGYGANRRAERPEGYTEGNRTVRYRRTASLFEEHFGLVPFTHGYREMERIAYLPQARKVLNDLLPDAVTLTETVDTEKGPLFNRAGTLLPFDALSDGFRAFVGWIWDLLYHIARVQAGGRSANLPNTGGLQVRAAIVNPDANKLVDLPGVVIVDEIDLFLHPEWQLEVVEKVAKAFPKIQFLFSTHSPLVAGTLEPENIYMLETDSGGAAIVEQYQEDIHGLTANQILISSYFGLRSTRAPGTGTLNDLAQSELAAQEAAPASLESSASPLPDSQKDLLERLMAKAKQREEAIRGGSKG